MAGGGGAGTSVGGGVLTDAGVERTIRWRLAVHPATIIAHRHNSASEVFRCIS